MRILSQLRLVSATCLVGLVALGYLLIWSWMDFRAATAKEQLLEAIHNSVFDVSSLSDQYFLYRDERSKSQWNRKYQDAARLIAQAMDQFPDRVNRQTMMDLRRNLEDHTRIFLLIADNTKALQTAGHDRAIYEELDKRLLSQLLVKATAIHDNTNTLHESGEKQVDQTYRRLVVSVALGALAMALITTSTLFFVVRLIRSRLAILHAGAKVVASGQLDFRLECKGSDELAEVAQSINSMTKKLQGINSQLEVELAERKQAERALAQFNRDFETFLEQTTDFIYFKDFDRRFRFCSQTLADITGHVSWRDMIGKHDLEVFPVDTARVYYEEEHPIFTEGKSLLNKIDPYYDADGRSGYVQTNKWPLFDEHGKVTGIFGISRDITDQKCDEARLRLAASDELKRVNDRLIEDIKVRKRAEQALHHSRSELRKLADHLDRVREDERKRIARDIHDDLGQDLIALRIEVSMMAERPNSVAVIKERINAALSRIDTTIDAVRGIINDLRPAALELGLHAAVEWQAMEFERRSSIACELDIDPDEFALDDKRATALFRIVQESLTNIIRHAQASRVRIEIRQKDDRLFLTIADDGVGLSPDSRSKANSFGLVGIEERIHAMGGTFSIASTPGQGMAIMLSIPITMQV